MFASIGVLAEGLQAESDMLIPMIIPNGTPFSRAESKRMPIFLTSEKIDAFLYLNDLLQFTSKTTIKITLVGKLQLSYLSMNGNLVHNLHTQMGTSMLEYKPIFAKSVLEISQELDKTALSEGRILFTFSALQDEESKKIPSSMLPISSECTTTSTRYNSKPPVLVLEVTYTLSASLCCNDQKQAECRKRDSTNFRCRLIFLGQERKYTAVMPLARVFSMDKEAFTIFRLWSITERALAES